MIEEEETRLIAIRRRFLNAPTPDPDLVWLLSLFDTIRADREVWRWRAASAAQNGRFAEIQRDNYLDELAGMAQAYCSQKCDPEHGDSGHTERCLWVHTLLKNRPPRRPA